MSIQAGERAFPIMTSEQRMSNDQLKHVCERSGIPYSVCDVCGRVEPYTVAMKQCFSCQEEESERCSR